MRLKSHSESVAYQSRLFVAAFINGRVPDGDDEQSQMRRRNIVGKIEVVGHGFGAVVAAYFCRYVHDHYGAKVATLLGMTY